MRCIYLWMLLLFFTSKINAQQISAQPAPIQYSLLVGTTQIGIGGEWRFSNRLVWHADIGFGAHYLYSDYYGQYQQAPDPYRHTGTLFDLGETWWAFYLNNELRLLSKDQSGYLGLKFKAALPEIPFQSASSPDSYPYRSTYKIGPIVGGQLPLDLKGSWKVDLQLGFGLLANHNFSYLDNAFIFNLSFFHRIALK